MSGPDMRGANAPRRSMKSSAPAPRAMQSPCRSPTIQNRSPMVKSCRIFFSGRCSIQPSSMSSIPIRVYAISVRRSGSWIRGEKDVAGRYIAQLNSAKVFNAPIATRVDPNPGFFRAETYHQDYLVRHPDAGYIATYDLPKVAQLKSSLPGRLSGDTCDGALTSHLASRIRPCSDIEWRRQTGSRS